jgi:hypothetical protein
VQTLALREVAGLSLTASARNLAMVKFGEWRRAAAQTSAASMGSPLSAKAPAVPRTEIIEPDRPDLAL